MNSLASRTEILDRLRSQSLELRISQLHEALKASDKVKGDYEVVGTFPRHVLFVLKENGACKRAHFIDKDGKPNITFVEDVDLPLAVKEEADGSSVRNLIAEAVAEVLEGKDAATLHKLVPLFTSAGAAAKFVQDTALASLKQPHWWTTYLAENMSSVEAALVGKLELIETQKPKSRFKPGQEPTAPELEALLVGLKDMAKTMRGRLVSATESISKAAGSEDESVAHFRRLMQEASDDLALVTEAVDGLDRAKLKESAESYEIMVPVVSRAVVVTNLAEHLLERMGKDQAAG